MPRQPHAENQRFHNEDLVLEVSSSIDRKKWDEDKYDQFLDELCGRREYQKEAILVALRYLLGQEYKDLRALAKSNFESSDALRDRYGSWENMQRNLQLPEQLAASLDLATGTGKSYVMYAIAAIMLAEGAVDRVLVLCPSTTIESGLLEKFEELAGDADLRDLLPESAVINSPRIINASESIVEGSICIENYHAILEHVRSSIRDSIKGKGARTLVLNDEAHHVANDSTSKVRRWKEFLTDRDFGFRFVIGVSGTCYVGNDYFSDVIFRYSLRQAIEERFVKKVQYVAEMPQTSRADEKWQLILNRHSEITKKLKVHKIRPITIVVTQNIECCKDVGEELKAFLVEHMGRTREQIDEQILVVHSNAPDLPRLRNVNNANNKVEWILSVSMLNEGWDVRRVFQVVPHEERAFNSKLLIAQVLGRGLRIPDNWTGEQPEVTVFNHDAWAPRIRHLVDEVMELEKRIPSFPLIKSEFNFELTNIKYDPRPYTETYPMDKHYKLLGKGFVDLATEQPIEDVNVEFEEADTGSRTRWQTKIRHATYSPREVAEIMFHRFEDVLDKDDRKYYTSQFPVSKLEEIIKLSLKKKKLKVITDGIKQKFLQALGTLQRKETQVVRYNFEPENYFTVSTKDRPQESVRSTELKSTKTLFYTGKTVDSIPDEYKEFYEEATEDASGYKCARIPNSYDFKTGLNAVIADHDNERRFIKDLVNSNNAAHITAWIKSTHMNFYEIDYSWKQGTRPKRGRFNPDFFIKIGNLILVVEIKGEEELAEPSEENRKKREYALKHFGLVNAYLRKKGSRDKYKLIFLCPSDFGKFFQSIRDESVGNFCSNLDVELAK